MNDKKKLFYCIVILAIVSLFLVNQNHTLEIQNNTLQIKIVQFEAQKTSYEDYLAFNRTYINLNGNGGMFDGDRNMLYVKTNYGNKFTCLIFMHELGHAIEYQKGNTCFYSEDLNDCEQSANIFKEQNAWRCTGI